MTMGFDDVSATTTGAAAVAEVQLNGAASLTTPQSANGIVEIIPYMFPEGAFTSDESEFLAFRIASDDVAIEPKRFNLPVTYGGDTAFVGVSSPGLHAYSLNIPLPDQSRINYFAQPQVANTVASDVGATVVYTDGGVGPEQFYQKPDNESAGAVAVDTRNIGNSITITGGREINKLLTFVAWDSTAGAATTDELIAGFMEFVSSDFLTSMPYRVAVDPVLAGGEAAAVVMSKDGMTEYTMPNGNGIPIAGRTVINTFYTNRDAKTNPDVFIGNVGFLK